MKLALVTVVTVVALVVGGVVSTVTVDDALRSSADLLQLYRSYKSANRGSMLRSPRELGFRLRQFRKTLERIHDINSQNLGWTAGLTIFSDMTDAEKAAYGGVDMNRTMTEEEVAPLQFTASPPASLDWRDQGSVTAVKDQGPTMACWAYSTVATLETKYHMETGNLVNFADQELMDCVYEDTNHSGNSGGHPSEAMKYIRDEGRLATRAVYPTTGRDVECKSAGKANGFSNYKLTYYYRVQKSADELQPRVNLGYGPIVAAYELTGYHFEYIGGLYDDPYCDVHTKKNYHAVAVVGYTPEAFIFKNSYGNDWGENGYGNWKRGSEKCGFFNWMVTFSIAEKNERKEVE